MCELVNITFIGAISSVLVLAGGVGDAHNSYALGVIFATFSVVAFTGTYIFPKQTKTISTHMYLLLGQLFTMCMYTIYVMIEWCFITLFTERSTLSISAAGVGFAALSGFAAFATSWCFTVAVKWGKPSSIASLEFTGILISLIIDYFVYNYHITITDGICSFLLVASGIYVFLYCQHDEQPDGYVDLEQPLIIHTQKHE